MTEIQHPTVPIEYAGKWIAWDHAMKHILASGATLDDVLEAAEEVGETDPVLAKAPPANVRLIGLGLR